MSKNKDGRMFVILWLQANKYIVLGNWGKNNNILVVFPAA